MFLSACQTEPIPNVRFYAEIPFIDCPEGVFVETVTHKSGTVSCEEWRKMRPFMIMLDPAAKKIIFNKWEEACRFAGDGKTCNVELESVRSAAEALDKLAEVVLGNK